MIGKLYRRFALIYADEDSPQRRRGRRELLFCLSGDDDKQNHVSIGTSRFCPIVVSRLGKYSSLSVLCVSAVIFLKNYILIQTWRPLRLCASHLYPDSVIHNLRYALCASRFATHRLCPSAVTFLRISVWTLCAPPFTLCFFLPAGICGIDDRIKTTAI